MKKEELLKGLTEEQIAKVKACKSQEELLKLAKEEGVELSDEQLTAVSGGGCTGQPKKCRKCGSTDIQATWYPCWGYECKCFNCGNEWKDT